MESIKEGRAFLNKERHNGAICPCCGQFVKVYKRPVTPKMAKNLITLYRVGRTNWVDIKSIDVRGGDYAKLRHWGLTEQSSRGSGLWRLTLRGMKFVLEQICIPRRAHIYNNQVLAFSGREVSIRECLKNVYNYGKLIAGK